jgi:hypothetical protein
MPTNPSLLLSLVIAFMSNCPLASQGQHARASAFPRHYGCVRLDYG